MHTGVMVPGKPTYFSRFALKFAEILGAGIAMAVADIGTYCRHRSSGKRYRQAHRTATQPRDRERSSRNRSARGFGTG
jgi:hypothetical protein